MTGQNASLALDLRSSSQGLLEALPGVLGNKGNWGTREQCQNILRNKGPKTIENNFKGQKAGNKFESNLGNKGTQANI